MLLCFFFNCCCMSCFVIIVNLQFLNASNNYEQFERVQNIKSHHGGSHLAGGKKKKPNLRDQATGKMIKLYILTGHNIIQLTVFCNSYYIVFVILKSHTLVFTSRRLAQTSPINLHDSYMSQLFVILTLGVSLFFLSDITWTRSSIKCSGNV